MEHYTDRAAQHHISAMVANIALPTTMAGANAVECSKCNVRAEHIRTSFITQPPEHLMLSLGRMAYSAAHGKTIKFLDTVGLVPCVELPSVPDAVAKLVYRSDGDGDDTKAAEAAASSSRRYGLYGVVVHSGQSANSGHYYVYARSSEAANLHLGDSPGSPWVKFNDTRVSLTDWSAMQSALADSILDTSYVLLFRRLDNAPQPEPVPLAADGDSKTPEDDSDDDADVDDLSRALAMSLAEQAPAAAAATATITAEAAATVRVTAVRPHQGGASKVVTAHTLSPWLARVVEDNVRYVMQVLRKRTHSGLVRSYHALALLEAGLSQADEDGDGDEGQDEGGAPSPPSVASQPRCGVCAQAFASREAAAEHEATCKYSQFEPDTCERCGALAPRCRFARGAVAGSPHGLVMCPHCIQVTKP